MYSGTGTSFSSKFQTTYQTLEQYVLIVLLFNCWHLWYAITLLFSDYAYFCWLALLSMVFRFGHWGIICIYNGMFFLCTEMFHCGNKKHLLPWQNLLKSFFGCEYFFPPLCDWLSHIVLWPYASRFPSVFLCFPLPCVCSAPLSVSPVCACVLAGAWFLLLTLPAPHLPSVSLSPLRSISCCFNLSGDNVFRSI